jgi:nicotinate-nucleotide pyrophosphorylase (carboxylating)
LISEKPTNIGLVSEGEFPGASEAISKLLSPELVRAQVHAALKEDIGAGDRTADLIRETAESEVRVVCREEAVLCGVAWFGQVFRQLDNQVRVNWSVGDGDPVSAGQTICTLVGNTRALLTGERTALNYLQTLSGTATQARRYADAVKGTQARILDTRKTLPGLRLQQKYAVTCGGCHNHRIGLFDAILIKENHILAAGSITAALNRAREVAGDLGIEVEVESPDELKEALAGNAHRVLLDNFSLDRLREAVGINNGQARLEASGGISLENIRSIAQTGVDDISVGALTKDVRAIDFSMRFAD